MGFFSAGKFMEGNRVKEVKARERTSFLKKRSNTQTAWVSAFSSRRLRRTFRLWQDGLPRRFAPRNDVVGLIVSESQANGVKNFFQSGFRWFGLHGPEETKVFLLLFLQKKKRLLPSAHPGQALQMYRRSF